jgi:hypothetical protein
MKMAEGAASQECTPAAFWIRKAPRMPQMNPESAEIATVTFY